MRDVLFRLLGSSGGTAVITPQELVHVLLYSPESKPDEYMDVRENNRSFPLLRILVVSMLADKWPFQVLCDDQEAKELELLRRLCADIASCSAVHTSATMQLSQQTAKGSLILDPERLTLDQAIVVRLLAQLWDEYASGGTNGDDLLTKYLFNAPHMAALWKRSPHSHLRNMLDQLFLLLEQGLHEPPKVLSFR